MRFSRVVQQHSPLSGRGFQAVRLWHEDYGGLADPFLLVDHFRMSDAVFPAHPHAGFSPLTYVFPDSPNSMRHADTLGNRLLIHPGSLHWTLAGRGLQHKEDPEVLGSPVHGLQIWLNLPSARKFDEPQIFHRESKEIEERDGVRWIADPLAAQQTPQPFGMVDVHRRAGESFSFSLPREWQTLAYVYGDGALAIEKNGDQRIAPGGSSFAFAGTDTITFRAQAETRFVLLASLPQRESIVVEGPFVMNTHDQIADTIRRYRAGEFGKLI